MSNLNISFTSSKNNRLDVIIFDYIKDTNCFLKTRSKVQNYIELYGVFVNSEYCNKPNSRIRLGDSIKINWSETKQELNQDLTKYIQVVREDKNYMVINKPPGLVVHEGAGHQGDTLADWLEIHLPSQKTMKNILESDTTHPTPHLGGGMVHRLDKDTQGLMIIAKDIQTFKYLQDQFRTRSVKKKYLALLVGKLDFQVQLSGYQARTRKNVLKQYFTLENPTDPVIAAQIAKQVPIKGDWRTSMSNFTPLLQNKAKTLTLTEIEIFTGRMHQIRTQAEFLGYPLYQDPLYKIPSGNDLQKLQENYPEHFALNNCQVNVVEDHEFQELTKKIFQFEQRDSFFLMSNYIHFTDPDSKDVELILYESVTQKVSS
ncbi:MAG: RluA family pseudouridine synthase [Patescibacteria group bacterium]